MPTFPISSSAHFLLPPSFIFFFSGGGGGGGARPTSSSSSSSSNLLLLTPTNTNTNTNIIIFNSSSAKTLTNNNYYYPSSSSKKKKKKQQQQQQLLFSVTSSSPSNNSNSTSNFDDLPPPPPAEVVDDNNIGISDSSETTPPQSSDYDDNGEVDIEIQKIGNNSRRILSRISIDATLETVWELLTDYEGLSDFIPGLSVSQLIEKGHNFAKIFQIGQQNLAFGVNFNAKGIVDCYEKDLETLPFGRRKRDIDFKMVEGDFQTFQGKWSIEETCSTDRPDVDQISGGGECHTTATTVTLSYIVDVMPKLWLPVGLVEGRLCREVSLNLVSIREEAQKKVKHTLPTC